MRTNIELNDQLIENAQALTGIKTKKGVVEEALKLLIQVQQQKQIRIYRGKVEWEGDLNQIKEGRHYDIG